MGSINLPSILTPDFGLFFWMLVAFLVAFIQAYVFTMLSAVFIGLAHPEHEGH